MLAFAGDAIFVIGAVVVDFDYDCYDDGHGDEQRVNLK